MITYFLYPTYTYTIHPICYDGGIRTPFSYSIQSASSSSSHSIQPAQPHSECCCDGRKIKSRRNPTMSGNSSHHIIPSTDGCGCLWNSREIEKKVRHLQPPPPFSIIVSSSYLNILPRVILPLPEILSDGWAKVLIYIYFYSPPAPPHLFVFLSIPLRLGLELGWAWKLLKPLRSEILVFSLNYVKIKYNYQFICISAA